MAKRSVEHVGRTELRADNPHEQIYMPVGPNCVLLVSAQSSNESLQDLASALLGSAVFVACADVSNDDESNERGWTVGLFVAVAKGLVDSMDLGEGA